MALNSSQIAEILFKKVAAGKATTALGRFFGNGEEPYSGRSFVDLSQIWAQSNLIPTTAAALTGIVEHVVDVHLENIPGTSSFMAPNGTDLTNIIPFNYGDGTSYAYTLKQNDGSTIIPPGVNDWFLDTETGILTFFSGDTTSTTDFGTLPTGVTTANGPYLSCYRYIGTTAADTGLGGGGGGSIGEWADSVLGFSSGLSGTITVYPDEQYIGTPISVTVSNGDRWIYVDNDATGMNIYDPATGAFSTGTILQFSIVEYYVGTQTGYKVTPPTTGLFTSVDYADTKIFRYNGSGWVQQSFEKTVPVKSTINLQETADNINGWQLLGTTTYAAIDGLYEAYVNGVRITEFTEFRNISLGAQDLTVSGQTYTQFDTVNPGSYAVGDLLVLDIPGGSPVPTNVIAISGNTITISNVGYLPPSYNVHSANTASATSLTDIYLCVNTSLLGYYVSPSENDEGTLVTYAFA